MVTYHSQCSTCVTYRTSCDAILHKEIPTQPFPGKQKISRRVADILRMFLCPHSSLTCNQTSLINNSGLMFICVKIINFLLVGKRLANYHFKAVKTSTHPTQRLTSVFIKIFSKMFSLKFLPQKYISKTLPSENTFQIMSYKLSKRKCIFVILRQNIVPSKNIFKTAS